VVAENPIEAVAEGCSSVAAEDHSEAAARACTSVAAGKSLRSGCRRLLWRGGPKLSTPV